MLFTAKWNAFLAAMKLKTVGPLDGTDGPVLCGRLRWKVSEDRNVQVGLVIKIITSGLWNEF